MKTILIVGHCGFDGPRLQKLAESIENVQALQLSSKDQLEHYLKENKPSDLMLINRVFANSPDKGLEVIEKIHQEYPNKKMMLISNYDDAQQSAIELGAIKGFGKSQLDQPETKKVIKEAIKL